MVKIKTQVCGITPICTQSMLLLVKMGCMLRRMTQMVNIIKKKIKIHFHPIWTSSLDYDSISIYNITFLYKKLKSFILIHFYQTRGQ